MNQPNDAPMISEAMITEYIKQEKDPEWIYSFVGKVATKEPILWNWIESMAENAVFTIATKSPQAFANPILGSQIVDELNTMFIRGYFMGIRKYETSLESMFGTIRFANERPKIKKRRKKGPDDTVGESEVTPDDLAP